MHLLRVAPVPSSVNSLQQGSSSCLAHPDGDRDLEMCCPPLSQQPLSPGARVGAAGHSRGVQQLVVHRGIGARLNMCQ